MPQTVKPVPEGFHTLTPRLVVRDAPRAIEFYRQAFGAEPQHVHYAPDGRTVIHANLRIGDSMMMLNDEFPDWGVLSPLSSGAVQSSSIHIYVEDADAVFARAVAAGATVKMPMMDAFWGDRYGQVVDPFGHQWSLATRLQALTDDEIAAAGRAAMSARKEAA